MATTTTNVCAPVTQPVAQPVAPDPLVVEEADPEDVHEAVEEEMFEPEVIEWVPCVVDVGYEIASTYPHQVRRRRGTRIVSEFLDATIGYVRLSLNRRIYCKHRVVALQFVPNPNPAEFTEVDHINRVRTDNRVVNLRWVSSRMNAWNKTSLRGVVCRYTNTIPDDVVPIHMYNNHVFKDYFYSRTTDTCYFYNGLQYRFLNYHVTRAGRTIGIRDIKHNLRTVYLNKWLRERV